MSEFGRRFEIDALLDSNFKWLDELLQLSKPSGVGSDDPSYPPLRMAVRTNYLNFYFNGQSIAQVRFDRNNDPYMKTHGKYLLSKVELEARTKDEKDQFHGQLKGGDDFFQIEGRPPIPYNGIKDLILRSIKYSGDEKRFVEELVRHNSNIIDLEMAIPCPGLVKDGVKGRDVALRLDAVALEEVRDGIKVVFWEAKLHSDSRCRSGKDKEPEVVKQLSRYREFTENPNRQTEVVAAYMETAKVLSAIYGSKLNANISRLAEIAKTDQRAGSVSVDSEPRLIIDSREIEASPYKRSKVIWDEHVSKLEKRNVKFELVKDDSALSVISRNG
jgi:hypothetical protein